jgi:hypothetical protein
MQAPANAITLFAPLSVRNDAAAGSVRVASANSPCNGPTPILSSRLRTRRGSRYLPMGMPYHNG